MISVVSFEILSQWTARLTFVLGLGFFKRMLLLVDLLENLAEVILEQLQQGLELVSKSSCLLGERLCFLSVFLSNDQPRTFTQIR